MRRYYLYDRKLLSDLARCAWDSLEAVMMPTLRNPDPSPGAVIAIQTFGDFLNFNPHCHVLCKDGVFYRNGWFKVAPALDTGPLEEVFQHTVLKMLLRKWKITEKVVKLILSWRHSGFNVYCGPRIRSGDEAAMENLARYTCPPLEDHPGLPRIRYGAGFSQERMTYFPEQENIFDALEWLAAMCSHVPNKGEQMVRYYGYYSPAVGAGSGSTQKGKQGRIAPLHLAAR